MDSSARLFGRQRSVHRILGGGIVADVVLWRRRDVTVGILLGLLAAWLVFERSGYTLLSFVSNVLLLLISILFTWARAAAILNRPPPPIPEMHLTKEVMNEAAVLVHSHVNMALLAFHDVALGKDSKLFYRVAISLWLISVIGSLTDFLTLFYSSLVIVFTIPVLYEKYEDDIDRYLKLAYVEMQMCKGIYAEHFHEVKNWILGKKKPG
ncbi:reticulon-like protein B12 [Phoenix dactylifera]|uniref:Reticulon-like protein n=1 Tax=Phoenix dactylifera TaxID=42345 RepID=A0A8B7BU80_PHODC|nr:reticulon-like protein B12 [Phoenix dactylifera]